MGKDIKEKYERVCAIKDKALSLLEMGINQDVKDIDAKEIGELMDIVKDTEEAIKYAEEACYYSSVVKAMEDSTEEEKKYYIDKYIPEMAMYYTPMSMARARDSRGRYMYTPEPMMYDDRHEPDFDRSRMYYSSTGSNSNINYERDYREGRSGITRRTYLDMKNADKTAKMDKFKEYIDNFKEDMEEMFIEGKSTPEEKSYAKQALAQFIAKL